MIKAGIDRLHESGPNNSELLDGSSELRWSDPV